MNLSDNLRQQAIGLGLCRQWQEEWGTDPTEQQLIDKFRRGIDFCIARHWPSCDFINAHFDRDLLRKNGILVNDRYSLLNPTFAALLGSSTSTIRFSGNKPSHVYIGGGTVAKIFVKSSALILVEVRDSAQVEIVPDAYYQTDIKVYSYSENAVVITPRTVPVITKKDYLLQ